VGQQWMIQSLPYVLLFDEKKRLSAFGAGAQVRLHQEYRRLSSSVQDPELRELALELNDSSFPVHLAVQASLGAVDTRGKLGVLELPVLVTGSEHDETCGDEPRRIAAEIPGAVYADFPGSRHSPFLEERDRFCEVLGEWLEGLAQVPS